jgi:phosphoribosyl 1,2-cyclic phosphodiesterase
MQITVRINGTLPNFSSLGSEDESDRADEIKKQNMSSNTSCSIFLQNETNQIFHILFDVGQGVVQSIEKGVSDIGLKPSSSSSLSSSSPLFPISTSSTTKSSSQYLPDALLVTHAHDDHIKELPILIDKVIDSSKKLSVFCTLECYNQLTKIFPQLTSPNTKMSVSFNIIQPNNSFNVDQFSITPVLVNHGNDIPRGGAVIYIVNVYNRKIVIGWDFLSLGDIDEHLLWNPDLLILGTQTYNPHPETGMISVTDAYNIIRRWNAKECYLVHYSGLNDFEESKNQWFRGPIKPMTSDDLQRTINSSIPITGGNEFKITVAKEGMIYNLSDEQKESIQQYGSNNPVGTELLIESLKKYVLKFEKDVKNDKLKLMIEDRINRSDLSFDKPRKDPNNDNLLHAQGEKGMLATGPYLRMEVIEADQAGQKSSAIIRIHVFKGRKDLFNDDISITDKDATILRKYIAENF